MNLRRFLVAVLATGAAWSAAASTCELRSVQVVADTRTAIVCTPTAAPVGSAQESWPLVIVFHGRDSRAIDILDKTKFHEQWPQALVIYPNGRDGAAGKPGKGWQMDPGQDDDLDLRFVDVMFSVLIQRYPWIDRSRVFATGHSNGSRFVGVLWKTRGSYITRLAFSAGPADELIKTAPARSVFMGMGENDNIVPLNLQYPSVDYAAALLGIPAAIFNRAPGTKEATNTNGLDMTTYIHQYGHDWPPGQTLKIVDFFKRSSFGR